MGMSWVSLNQLRWHRFQLHELSIVYSVNIYFVTFIQKQFSYLDKAHHYRGLSVKIYWWKEYIRTTYKRWLPQCSPEFTTLVRRCSCGSGVCDFRNLRYESQTSRPPRWQMGIHYHSARWHNAERRRVYWVLIFHRPPHYPSFTMIRGARYYPPELSDWLKKMRPSLKSSSQNQGAHNTESRAYSIQYLFLLLPWLTSSLTMTPTEIDL